MTLPSNFFIDQGAVHEKEVKLPNGTAHKMYFKDISQATWDAFMRSRYSEDEKVRDAARANLIASSLCEPDGTLALTTEDAARLKPAFALAISNAVMKANEFGVDEGNG